MTPTLLRRCMPTCVWVEGRKGERVEGWKGGRVRRNARGSLCFGSCVYVWPWVRECSCCSVFDCEQGFDCEQVCVPLFSHPQRRRPLPATHPYVLSRVCVVASGTLGRHWLRTRPCLRTGWAKSQPRPLPKEACCPPSQASRSSRALPERAPSLATATLASPHRRRPRRRHCRRRGR